MVPWEHPSPQPKRHLDRFSHFAGLTGVTVRQTDRPTDYATRLVTIVRIYVRSTAMRPKNTHGLRGGASPVLTATGLVNGR